MSRRTVYTKYHEKMKKLLKDCDCGTFTFVPDSVFNDYGNYLMKTVGKESRFKLYRYSALYYYDKKKKENRFSFDLEKLYFSPNGNLNDIFEGLPNDDMSIYPLEERLDKLSKIAALKCFTESFDNNLMWAHYSDSHKGICVEYDFKKINDDEILKLLFPVIYSKERNIYASSDILIDFLKGDKELQGTKDAKGIFLQKDNCWRYEKEWRICLMNHSDEIDTVQEMEFPSVTAIYIGARTPKEDIEKIKYCVKEYEEKHKYTIKLYQMKLNDNSYDLIPKEIH